jgi:hypothetical protein
METQTIIVGICVFVLVILLIANIFVSSQKDQKESMFCTSNICMVLVIIFIILPIALIQTYSVQCMVTGGCDRFVWIITSIVILCTIAYIGLFIWKIYKQKNITRVESEYGYK